MVAHSWWFVCQSQAATAAGMQQGRLPLRSPFKLSCPGCGPGPSPGSNPHSTPGPCHTYREQAPDLYTPLAVHLKAAAGSTCKHWGSEQAAECGACRGWRADCGTQATGVTSSSHIQHAASFENAQSCGRVQHQALGAKLGRQTRLVYRCPPPPVPFGAPPRSRPGTQHHRGRAPQRTSPWPPFMSEFVDKRRRQRPTYPVTEVWTNGRQSPHTGRTDQTHI